MGKIVKSNLETGRKTVTRKYLSSTCSGSPSRRTFNPPLHIVWVTWYKKSAYKLYNKEPRVHDLTEYCMGRRWHYNIECRNSCHQVILFSVGNTGGEKQRTHCGACGALVVTWFVGSVTVHEAAAGGLNPGRVYINDSPAASNPSRKDSEQSLDPMTDEEWHFQSAFHEWRERGWVDERASEARKDNGKPATASINVGQPGLYSETDVPGAIHINSAAVCGRAGE